MGRTRYCVGVDVNVAMTNGPRYCASLLRGDDGSQVKADEAFNWFEDKYVAGFRVVPMGDCDNWDPVEGCKGHPVLPGGDADEFSKVVGAVRASGGVTVKELKRDLELSYVEAWDVLDRLRRERVVESGSVDGFFRVIVDVAPVVMSGAGSGSSALGGVGVGDG